MEKRYETDSVLPALLVVAGAFFLGSLAGWLVAGSVSGTGNQTLAAYLEGYLSSARAETAVQPAMLPLLWELFRWPLGVLIFSFTAFGVLAIPALFAARGFLLSFAVCSFARMFGGNGCVLAAVVFGISSLVAVPALFLLGVKSWDSARALMLRAESEKRRSIWPGRRHWKQLCLCGVLFLACVSIEYFVVPPLLSVMAKLLLL